MPPALMVSVPSSGRNSSSIFRKFTAVWMLARSWTGQAAARRFLENRRTGFRRIRRRWVRQLAALIPERPAGNVMAPCEARLRFTALTPLNHQPRHSRRPARPPRSVPRNRYPRGVSVNTQQPAQDFPQRPAVRSRAPVASRSRRRAVCASTSASMAARSA